MKAIALLALILIHLPCSAETPEEDEPGSAFRKPFTLTLQVDKQRVYKEEFKKMPFVHKNVVYLFKGDEFGVRVLKQAAEIRAVTYEAELAKADITFKFAQEIKDGEPVMMMLEIKNNTQDTISMDALMTIPGKAGVFKTTILPLLPGLSGFESWPHPIAQLALRNFKPKR